MGSQTDDKLLCSECAHCNDTEDSRRIVDINSSLVIYSYKNKEQLAPDRPDPMVDVLIIHNKKDEELKPADFILSEEKYKIFCPRCKYIFQHVQNLLRHITIMNKRDTLGLCTCCGAQPKFQTPCNHCKEAVRKCIADTNKTNGNVNNNLTMVLSEVNNLMNRNASNTLKNTSYVDTDFTSTNTRGDLSFDVVERYGSYLSKSKRQEHGLKTEQELSANTGPLRELSVRYKDTLDLALEHSNNRNKVVTKMKIMDSADNEDLNVALNSNDLQVQMALKVGLGLEAQNKLDNTIYFPKVKPTTPFKTSKKVEEGVKQKINPNGDVGTEYHKRTDQEREKISSKASESTNKQQYAVVKKRELQHLTENNEKLSVKEINLPPVQNDRTGRKQKSNDEVSKKELQSIKGTSEIPNKDQELEKTPTKAGEYSNKKQDAVNKKELQSTKYKSDIPNTKETDIFSKKRIDESQRSQKANEEIGNMKRELQSNVEKSGIATGQIADAASKKQLKKDNESKKRNSQSTKDKTTALTTFKAKHIGSDKKDGEIGHKSTQIELDQKKIKIKNKSDDALILNLIGMRTKEDRRPQTDNKKTDIDSAMRKLTAKRVKKQYIVETVSESEVTLPKLINESTEMIVGENIVNMKSLPPPYRKIDETLIVPRHYEESVENKPRFQSTVPCLTDGENFSKTGIIKYVLSDPTFIDKGWTKLPTRKVVKRMNVFRMRPVDPDKNWFERHKNDEPVKYDTGENLSAIDEDGRGRWFYKNGRLALDYYVAEEQNAGHRFIVYSNGEPDERGRTYPITVLATFDHLGNGIVFDHSGKIRLKYNQTEGVLLDRAIGPVTHWQWHSLNDPPVLQQVMIDTISFQKDPNLARLDELPEKPKEENEAMLNIEFENVAKEKHQKMQQAYKPFQIKMKALKINNQFSLKVLDQSKIHLIFREGSINLKLNLGMLLDHHEIVDTVTTDVGEVYNSLTREHPHTDSLVELKEVLHRAQTIARVRSERNNKLKVPICSVDKFKAVMSRPSCPPMLTMTPTEMCHCSRKPSKNNVYYNNYIV